MNLYRYPGGTCSHFFAESISFLSAVASGLLPYQSLQTLRNGQRKMSTRENIFFLLHWLINLPCVFHSQFFSSFRLSEKLQPSTGYCAAYNGQICKPYLNGSIWYDITHDTPGGWLHEQITMRLWEEMIVSLNEPCRSAAEVLLCHYAFPQCGTRDGQVYGKPLCR